MRILALETSTRETSVALLEEDVCVATQSLPIEMGTAQALAPAIAGQLAEVNWKPNDVELIAVSQGPGSFTGLRVGVTTAKTMAYAVGAEVLAVSTLEVIACQVQPTNERIWAVMDAQRQQVFAACFQQVGEQLQPVDETAILDNSAWIEQLSDTDIVTGPGLKKLLDALPPGTSAADPKNWQPTAATVGRVALREFRRGRRDDLWKLVPRYYRKSAAEEKLDVQ